jgi:pimeloyl-ACP methyl ester carboxylesterase
MWNVVYCHGFASSPQSKKANLFRGPLEALGVRYYVPDLNQPSFQQLTLTAMLETVDALMQTLDDRPTLIVGSSMGGLVALHYCDRYRHTSARKVKKAVLLAPAFDFMANRDRTEGPGWEERWRAAGQMPFFNYATGQPEYVHYGLVEDIKQYDSWSVQLDIPVLIYHGIHDDVVDPGQSERYHREHNGVTLALLESDHQLLDQTDVILKGLCVMMGLEPPHIAETSSG